MLSEKISSVLKRISHAAMRAGRSPEEITLIAVTKTVGTEAIKEAIELGLRIFGENRVQEAREKIPLLNAYDPEARVQWHLIGHLQKNKAKYAVRLFDLIHSVDSGELAQELNKEAEKIQKVQQVLVQVKLSAEESKHGAPEEGALEVLNAVRESRSLSLKGLMTIPPFFEDPEKARPYFRRLRELRDRAEGEGFSLPELSMGMSDDFEAAIEEGATMVRIGTALFGKRG